jgi:hypothetical protein
LNSDLTVETSIDIAEGTLVLNGNDLTVNGTLNTAANAGIEGDVNAGLTLDGTGDVSLIFTPNGNVLGDLAISQNGNVSLGSDLVVENTIDLQQGSFVLNGNELTVNGTISTEAAANITGDANAGLTLAGTGDVLLAFSANGNVLGDFTINQANGSFTMSSDLAVENSLDIQQGAFVLNGNELTINGTINTAANAGIMGDVNAGLVFNGTGDASLAFMQNGNLLGDLTINQNGNVMLNSELSLNNELKLEQGHLILSDHNLVLKANAVVEGGSENSYVMTNGSGELSIFVEAGSNGSFFPCGSADGYFPAIIGQASGNADVQIGVNIAAGVFADGTTGSNLTEYQKLVNHTWFVSSSDQSAQLDLDFQFFWNAEAEVNGFNHNSCYISHFVNGNWDTYASAKANAEANGYFSIKREGITSLSPFRVVDGRASSTNTPVLADMEAYPNPANVRMFVKLPAAGNAEVAQIFDSRGILVSQQKLEATGAATQLDLSELQPGVYFLQVEGMSVKRFVKAEMQN